MDRWAKIQSFFARRKKLIQLLTLQSFSVFFLFGCGKPVEQVTSSLSHPDQYLVQELRQCPGCLQIDEPMKISAQVRARTNNARSEFVFDVISHRRDDLGHINNSSTFYEYYGRSTMTGYLRITETISEQLCGAPAGLYRIRPLTPSFLSEGSISGGTFEVIGPARLIFSLQTSRFYDRSLENGRVERRLQLKGTIELVGAQACNLQFFAE